MSSSELLKLILLFYDFLSSLMLEVSDSLRSLLHSDTA